MQRLVPDAAPLLLARVATLDADIATLLHRTLDAVSSVIGARLADLIGHRVALLLGDEAAASTWSSIGPLSVAEVACLQLVDQFVVSVSAITDQEVEAVAEQFPDTQLYGIVAALYVIEMAHRVDLALAAVFEKD